MESGKIFAITKLAIIWGINLRDNKKLYFPFNQLSPKIVK